MKPRFTSRAHQDVDEAAAFYRQRSLRAAAEFISAIDSAALAIQANPKACPKISGDLRRFVMGRFPYGMFYRIGIDETIVVGVVHAKRDPAVWRKRE